jgi:hypothetical protein
VICCLFFYLTIASGLPVHAADASQPDAHSSTVDPLVQILISKGILTPAEAGALNHGTAAQQHAQLLLLLRDKGVLSASDYASLTESSSKPPLPSPEPPAASQVSAALVASTTPMIPSVTAQTPSAREPSEAKPSPPAVVPAINPLRVLPLDPPVKDGLIPAFKIGSIKVTPYGFIKATAVYDTSAPNGDDFPFPGIFLNSSSVFDTGPTKNSSFHIKARSSRFGSNFEWMDPSARLTITGRVEGDFEGNFSEVDNADVSSIRNPGPRLRLAYGRLDYAAGENSDVFFEGGQNWSLFGSSALPSILETTFLGAFSGDVWERTPQLRFGLVQKLGGSRNFKFSPEFALMMPSTGQIYKLNGTLGGFEAQIGEGERQGADSGRPELEARAVLQFQLDKAPAVMPAQVLWSGYDARRTAITTSTNLSSVAGLPSDILTTYPHGFTNGSSLFGNQIAVQLPTRWLTFVASGYRGADMRFMLAGQLNTFYTDTSGLYAVETVPTVDNVGVAGAQQLGCTVAIAPGKTCTESGGSWVIARQRPVGAFGGFVNLGFPISRWFNANPKGRMAGWQLYLHAGKDQVVHHDIRSALGFGCVSADNATKCNGGIPLSQSKFLAGTVYYKLNNWIQFGFEESQYTTYATPEVGSIYTVAGKSSNSWKDLRSEFGPIFSF